MWGNLRSGTHGRDRRKLAECQDQGLLGQEGDITECNWLTVTEAEPQPGPRGPAAGPRSHRALV